MRIYVAFFLAAAVPVAGCGRGGYSAGSPEPRQPPEPVPAAAQLYYDSDSGIPDRMQVVIRDADNLERLWRLATGRQPSPPPPPEVDFGREMLILVAAGRMTPEDHIRVDSIQVHRRPGEDGSMRDVLVAVVRITEGCGRFPTPAHPTQIVRLRRFQGPVDFVERRDRVTDCNGAAWLGDGAGFAAADP